MDEEKRGFLGFFCMSIDNALLYVDTVIEIHQVTVQFYDVFIRIDMKCIAGKRKGTSAHLEM